MSLSADKRRDPKAQKQPHAAVETSTHLAGLAAALADVWRLHHRVDQEFTHFSQVHCSLSMIDYFLSTSSLLPHLIKLTIGNLVLSDYTPVVVEYSVLPLLAHDRICRFPSHLSRNERYKAYLQETWRE